MESTKNYTKLSNLNLGYWFDKENNSLFEIAVYKDKDKTTNSRDGHVFQYFLAMGAGRFADQFVQKHIIETNIFLSNNAQEALDLVKSTNLKPDNQNLLEDIINK